MNIPFQKNVGEIVLQDDECFWIFPRLYVFLNNFHIYSPWFSCMGEKWRFVLLSVLNYSTLSFYLWKKFRHDPLACKYTLQLKLKTTESGKEVTNWEGDCSCDNAFEASEFCTKTALQGPNISYSGRIKIFFTIRERHDPGNVPSCPSVRNNKNNSSSSEDEMSSDEEDDEKNAAIRMSTDKGIKTLLGDLKQVFLDGRMSDAILRVDCREFNVHKVILVARSPVFASMFEHDMAEKKDNAVEIPDCTAESFEVFLHFLYCGSAETLSASNVYDVYYAADKYRIDDLKEKCLELMISNISVETFCDVITLALRHGESRLQKAAVNFFSQNIKKIIKTVQWQKYLGENYIQANELLIKALNA